MLELITSYTFSQIPYITYDALDEYTEKLVRDFAPDCLCTPVPLDAEDFMDYYLGLSAEQVRWIIAMQRSCRNT